MAEARTVKCPNCGAPVKWVPENPYRPFCSERCKQIDLGAWASERYRVPTAPPSEGGDNPDTDTPSRD